MCHITEDELALFLLSCMKNRFFSFMREPVSLEEVRVALLSLAKR
jgi:hypothetical protein